MGDKIQVNLPHPEVVLKALGITRNKLDGKTRVAVKACGLKLLVEQMIALLPFDEAAYLEFNPDVALAFKEGNILDLHQHFLSAGYFEGRLAAHIDVDEDFYLTSYPDVAEAVRQREVASAKAHYMSAGAAEGRAPSRDSEAAFRQWIACSTLTDAAA